MGEFREDPTWRTHVVTAKRELLEEKLGPAILGDMRLGVPVDTGALLASLRFDVLSEDLLRFNSDKKYAAAVEEGHEIVYRDSSGALVRTGKHVPAQPYMKPALYRKRGDVS